MVSTPIRVLVVDDSAYIRKVISEMLRRSPLIEVVGTAWDGRDALEKVARLNPDVVTLDLTMPELDGVGFLQEQMRRRPIPIVVCTSLNESDEQAVAVMEAGVIEFVQKPTSLALDKVYEISDNLIEKVITVAAIPAERLLEPARVEIAPPLPSPAYPRTRGLNAVVIGASTGGPQALRYLLPSLPENFPVPVAMVLHMPEGYTGPFAHRLNQISRLEVREAEEGLEMKPGRVILGQAGKHLKLKRKGPNVVAHLDGAPEELIHRPSVDVLFQSAAEVYGAHILGVVMTGMGEDGARGAAWIKAQGGAIFTESELTCVVYGMPRAVVEAGLSDKIVLLSEFPKAILEAL
jgi:two-component system chemotaxis response regulator CheB